VQDHLGLFQTEPSVQLIHSDFLYQSSLFSFTPIISLLTTVYFFSLKQYILEF
jgi:hypothetical protein